MTHTELNLRERRVIEDILNTKIPVREIAAEVGRHVSTIYRDIKRNGYTDESGLVHHVSQQSSLAANRATVMSKGRKAAGSSA